MKFTDLDATEVREKPIRIELMNLKLGENIVPLEGQWIDVYPTESEAFQNAKLELSRKAITKEKFDTKMLVAALISDWSFDNECSEANKLEAIKIWPKVLIDHIDKVASSAVNFTKSSQSD